MKKGKINSINCIKLCLLLSFAVSSISEAKEYEFVDVLAKESLIADSKIDLVLRNRFKYLNENAVGPTYIHTAWSQSFGLDYRSGYWRDVLGFDVSYVSVAKLAASDWFASRDLLWNDGPGFKASNAKSYNKFSEHNVKLNLGSDDGVNFKSKYGWQTLSLNGYGVLISEYGAAKNSYFGYTGTLSYDNYSLDTLYFTKGMERFSPNQEKLKTRSNADIEYIMSVGGNYNSPNLTASYNYGNAKDYIDRHEIELKYKPHSQLTLGAQVIGNIPLGMYKDMPANRRAADGNSWLYAVDARWQQDALGFKLGVGYSDANKKDGSLGYFDRHPVQNARWRMNTMSSAAYHYQRDGEIAITGLVDYKYAEDFYSAVQLNYGQFDYKHNKIETGELNLINAWSPSDPSLKNFTVFTKLTKAWLYQAGNDRNQPIFDQNGHYIKRNSLAADIIFDYKFTLK